MVSKENIETAKKIYSQLEKWNFANNTLTEYFKENKSNDSEKIVLIKVILIDGLYKTQLRDQISVAKHIFKRNNLDNRLMEGDVSIVEDIANWKNRKGKKIHILSFASKFCHFHNKKAYPLYDSYVCVALKKLLEWKDKRDYSDFEQAVNNFRKEIKGEEVSLEHIDKYLWLFGLREKLRKGRTDINREIYDFYNGNKEMFDLL